MSTSLNGSETANTGYCAPRTGGKYLPRPDHNLEVWYVPDLVEVAPTFTQNCLIQRRTNHKTCCKLLPKFVQDI